MDEFEIDDSLDTSFSDDSLLDSFESSGDAFDAMDSTEVPTIEDTPFDSIESGNIEDYSYENTELFYDEVSDVMNGVEVEELAFDDQPIEDTSTVEVLETEIEQPIEESAPDLVEIMDDIEPEVLEFDDQVGEPYEATPNSEIEILQEEGTVEALENIQEQLDSHEALSNMSEYMNAHNYGMEDYETYSKDPEWQALNRDLQIANGIGPVDVVEDTSVQSEMLEDVTLNDVNELDGWLKEINPNFDPFDWESPYNNNCGSCAYAVYRRLEGDNNIVATAENIGFNSEMEALTGMEQVSMTPYEIANRLLEQGDGSHAIIGIDRAEGPGHWFNAACIDGKVVAIDGQSGEVMDWPPDYGNVVNWEMSVKRDI